MLQEREQRDSWVAWVQWLHCRVEGVFHQMAYPRDESLTPDDSARHNCRKLTLQITLRFFAGHGNMYQCYKSFADAKPQFFQTGVLHAQ
jgi:hypothetical protein